VLTLVRFEFEPDGHHVDIMDVHISQWHLAFQLIRHAREGASFYTFGVNAFETLQIPD